MRRQSEKAINLANVYQNGKRQTGAVLISSFLPSIGGQSSEQRRFCLQSGGGTGFSEAGPSA